MDLSFIILSWNSACYLNACFDSITQKCERESLDFEIIAIDNGSTDESRNIIQSYHQKDNNRYILIALETNRGTTYSRNLGLKIAKGKVICILDSDTEIGEGEFRHLLDHLVYNSEVGLIAPRLVLSDGTIQNSVKKFPTFVGKLLKIPRALFKIPSPNIDFYATDKLSPIQLVDTAISACWFFKRQLIDQVGLLDEKIFYSPEDLDYCIRTHKAGLKVIYWTDLTIIHHTQQISHRSPFSRVSLSHFSGLLYYFHKHGGWLTTSHLYKQPK